MKPLTLSVFFLFSTTFLITANGLRSYCQTCTWAESADTKGRQGPNTYSSTIVTDASGNVYVCGNHDGDISFGTTALSLADSPYTSIFIVKYNAAGSVIWAKTFGGTSQALASSMSIDNSGNLYVFGSYSGTSLSFGSITLSNPDNFTDFFLMKADSSGTVVWAKNIVIAQTAAASFNSAAASVATDVSGNVYITGSFDSSIAFGSILFSRPSTEGYVAFIAKYDSLGNALWAKHSDSTGVAIGTSITVNQTGDIYVTGEFGAPAVRFDTVVLTDASANNASFFLVKYNDVGTCVWARSAGDSNEVVGYGVVTDASDNVFVTGVFSAPNVNFGTYALTNADPSARSNDIFTAMYNSSGTIEWAKQAGGPSDDNSNSIAIDGSGSVFITGSFLSPSITFGPAVLTNYGFFMAKYNNSGSVVWAKDAASITRFSASEVGTSITHDASGNLYVTGAYDSSIQLDAVTLSDTSSPYGHIFTAKFDDIIEGISPIKQNAAGFFLYPNPTSGLLTITSTDRVNSISIYDLFGRVVYSNEYNTQTVQLDVTDLPCAVYFIRINGAQVRKFVKY